MIRKTISASFIFALLATPAFAESKRQHGAHEHGHGTLNMALEGNRLVMELIAPGADIVGFEHAAQSAEDHAKIAKAEQQLSEPANLFALPEKAGCRKTSVEVHFAGLDEAEPGSLSEHKHGHASHDDHKKEGAGAGHSEVHAEYTLTCAHPETLTTIDFHYFRHFPNAEELDVTLITPKGQKAFEVSREHARIDIRGMI